MIKDDALPQRVLRKLSSRRKKRHIEENDGTTSGGKSLTRKAPGDASKNAKIEEQSNAKNKTVESEGYQNSRISSVDEHDVKTIQKTSGENNIKLNAISETSASNLDGTLQNGTLQNVSDKSKDDDKFTRNDITLADNAVISTVSLKKDIEKELNKVDKELEENGDSILIADTADECKRTSMFSTDC